MSERTYITCTLVGGVVLVGVLIAGGCRHPEVDFCDVSDQSVSMLRNGEAVFVAFMDHPSSRVPKQLRLFRFGVDEPEATFGLGKRCGFPSLDFPSPGILTVVDEHDVSLIDSVDGVIGTFRTSERVRRHSSALTSNGDVVFVGEQLFGLVRLRASEGTWIETTLPFQGNISNQSLVRGANGLHLFYEAGGALKYSRIESDGSASAPLALVPLGLWTVPPVAVALSDTRFGVAFVGAEGVAHVAQVAIATTAGVVAGSERSLSGPASELSIAVNPLGGVVVGVILQPAGTYDDRIEIHWVGEDEPGPSAAYVGTSFDLSFSESALEVDGSGNALVALRGYRGLQTGTFATDGTVILSAVPGQP